ncbi:MAG: hypothetical protein ACRCYN_12150 [Plesiomonas sp.]
MITALILTVILAVLVALMFSITASTEHHIAPASEFSAWDRDLESARALRDLAAHCKAARGVRK